MKNNKKIIVILGPTAGGKTGIGVKLAHKFNGEIVSADSRQVYKGMDIGTGKDLCEFDFKVNGKVVKIPYHLIDVVEPNDEYNIARFQKDAYLAIDDILRRGKLPIVVGGSGLYLQAIVDGYGLSKAKDDIILREKLEKKDTEELFEELKILNSKFADNLNNSDKNNNRRLIRYIEIAKTGEKPKKSEPKYDCLILGIERARDVLRERIYKRLIQRLENEDMIDEVERLNREGVSFERLKKFGLEYKFISMYLLDEITYEEMVDKLNIAIAQFAKRQMSWFRRWEKQGVKINWIEDFEESVDMVDKFKKG